MIEPYLTLSGILRRIILLALVGGLVLLFLGPILTAAVAILSFTFVGLVLYLPLHTLFFGPRARWRHHVVRGRAHCRLVAGVLHAHTRSALRRCEQGLELLHSGLCLLGSLLLEASCGALIGCLLAWLTGPEHLGLALLTGALFGAAVGVLVVLSRLRPFDLPGERGTSVP